MSVGKSIGAGATCFRLVGFIGAVEAGSEVICADAGEAFFTASANPAALGAIGRLGTFPYHRRPPLGEVTFQRLSQVKASHPRSGVRLSL